MTFRVSGPWNVCCLACRNPGEHLKLDGLERAGSLGGRHSFHLFVLAVVTLKSAPGFQPVFHISSSSLRQCVAVWEEPKECVEAEDDVAGCCCWLRMC